MKTRTMFSICGGLFLLTAAIRLASPGREPLLARLIEPIAGFVGMLAVTQGTSSRPIATSVANPDRRFPRGRIHPNGPR